MTADTIGRASMFDARSRILYTITAIEIALGAALFIIFRFRLAVSPLPPLWAILMIVGAWMTRRVGHSAIAGTLETLALTYLQGAAAFLLLFPLTAMSLPFADDTLARADHWLGFDARQWILWVAGKPKVTGVLAIAYKSFVWQPLVILPLLAKDQSRAWGLVTAGAIAGVITSGIFPFAPAVGSYFHFGIRPSDIPLYDGHWPWEFGPVLEHIKAGSRVIDQSSFVGLISFPSYHAAAAMIFAWAAWKTPLRWPMLVLNLLILPACVLDGAHYLVDVVAGCMVAGLSIYMACAIQNSPRTGRSTCPTEAH